MTHVTYHDYGNTYYTAFDLFCFFDLMLYVHGKQLRSCWAGQLLIIIIIIIIIMFLFLEDYILSTKMNLSNIWSSVKSKKKITYIQYMANNIYN